MRWPTFGSLRQNECANTLAPASVAIDKLPTKVVGLVRPSAYSLESSANTTGWTTLRGNNSPAGALYAEFSAVAANVEAIAVALKQFDANGNPLASTGAVQKRIDGNFADARHASEFPKQRKSWLWVIDG
ncbi:MAG: hypothetical protein IPG16_22945 [Comamonadaceae bacterium]|nr:hypothetical protein [Comamonadaceae bacterium]